MAFPNAPNFQIDRSTFNEAQDNISYSIQRNYNHQINAHGEQDVRNRVHSVMKDHIYTDAYHDSGAQRDPSRCYPGTREAALETISHWAGDPSSHCLWLHGPAGTGKTAIAQTFAEQCQQDGTLGATYFFTRGSAIRLPQGPPPLISTLAYQLMSAFPDLDKHLWAAIYADQTIFEGSLSTQLEKLIIQPFLRLVSKSASVVVIIDGLDECDGDSIQGEIVRLILSLERYSLPLLFLISSRPEPAIQRAFGSSQCSSLAHLPLDKTLHPDRDIRHFLANEFERIYQQSVEMGMPPVLQAPWPSAEVIEKLVRKSSGHFIYAATVIKFVQEDYAHLMDRLDAILQIPSKVTGSAAEGAVSESIAFQELDELYLHILRKNRDRAEMVKVLHFIVYFNGSDTFPGYIETIFDLKPGSVRVILEGLHSIIDVPVGDGQLRPSHASFSDFLTDPERSTREFRLETSRFNAELACAFMRIIVAFSPARSGYSLSIAMFRLRDCLKASAGLLSDTLEEIMSIVNQRLESTPPCLSYIILDFLLRNILKEFPEVSPTERKHCETLLEQLQPNLIELEDSMLTILRLLGASNFMYSRYLGLENIGRLIGVPNGAEVFQRILPNLSYHNTGAPTTNFDNHGIIGDCDKPFQWIHESLYHWFLARHQLKPVDMSLPRYVAVHRYTWAWAWGAYAPPLVSKYNDGSDIFTFLVHLVDLYYGCLRALTPEPNEPLNLIPPLTQEIVELTSRSLTVGVKQSRNIYWRHGDGKSYPDLVEIIERIDFTSVLQTLPNLITVFCPRFYYLHSRLDELYYCLQASDGDPASSCRPVRYYQEFLETIYSRLLQDPLASRAVLIIYAMFHEPSLSAIPRLLGLAVGDSAAMQGLFGISFLAEDEALTVSKSLGVLLKMGRIRLQTSQSAAHIDDCMHSAHEYLAISCARRLTSRKADPGETVDLDPDWYAKCWSNHLMRARPSEQLFDTLRCVDISRRDIDPVLRWLEASPNAPEDVLARWHTARADPSITITDGSGFDWEEGKGCLLDQVVKQRLDLRARLDEDNKRWMEMERQRQQIGGDGGGWGQ